MILLLLEKKVCMVIAKVFYLPVVVGSYVALNVIGRAKTGHICTSYTCSENSTFLSLCL